MSKRIQHKRKESVAQSVPPKYLTKAPTLIALLDVENKPNDPTNDVTIAAEEFKALTNENHQLFKELQVLKAKHHDLLHYKTTIETELTVYKDQHDNNAQLLEDIDIYKSQITKLQLENTVLIDQLNQFKPNKSPTTSIENEQTVKFSDFESESSRNFMKQSLATLTQEKNELEAVLEQERKNRVKLEETIENLQMELNDKMNTAEILSNNLDKQQKEFLSLKKDIKQRSLEIEDSIDKNVELLQTMDQQTAYIQQLKTENKRLMVEKEKDDTEMFMELEQLRNSKSARSVRMGENRLKTQMNLLNGIDLENDGCVLDGLIYDKYLDSMEFDVNALQDIEDNHNDVFENEETTKDKNDEKIEKDETNQIQLDDHKDNQINKDNIDEKKEENESRKMRNMEMDFFLLTCIAIKANLAEEYPNKLAILNQDSMDLFVVSQKQHIEMRKFNLWIELQLRQRYNLPKLKGFKKFIKKYGFKEKTKTKLKQIRKYTKYGAESELPEMIRKYKKHKDNDEQKRDEYLTLIKEYSNDLLDEFKIKQTEYISQYEYTDYNEIQLFNNIFMRICTVLYYTRLCSVTFNEFEKEIEIICNGVKHDKITFCNTRENDIWSNIFKSHLDFIIVSAENECKLFDLNPFQSFCDKSVEFMKACYKSNYTKFSGTLCHFICEYILENDDLDDNISDGIIITFLKILSDRKNFMKMLYKSIERNNTDRKIKTNTEYQLYYKMHINDHMDIDEMYAQILAVIIVNIYRLEKINNSKQIDDNIFKEIDEKIDIVLQKCDELQLDEKTKSMIKFFFEYYFKGENQFDGVCSISHVDCILQ